MKLTLHDIHLFSSIKFHSSSDISFILVSQSFSQKKKKKILVSQSKSSACFAMPPQLVSLKVLVYYYYYIYIYIYVVRGYVVIVLLSLFFP